MDRFLKDSCEKVDRFHYMSCSRSDQPKTAKWHISATRGRQETVRVSIII